MEETLPAGSKFRVHGGTRKASGRKDYLGGAACFEIVIISEICTPAAVEYGWQGSGDRKQRREEFPGLTRNDTKAQVIEKER